MHRPILAALAVVTALAGSPAFAENVKPGAELPGHPGTTYVELVRAVVTDLAIDGNGYASGTQMAPLRHVVEGEGGAPPVAITLYSIDANPFRVDGRPMTLLYTVLGDGGDRVAETVLLALYDEQLQLVDAVDVGIYENNWFDSVFAISADSDAVRVMSEHFNSSQGYDATELVHFRDGELTLIDTIYTLSIKGGSYEEKQTVSVEVEDDGQPGYRPITATVHATRTVEPQPDPEPGEDPAEPLAPAYDRTYSQTYNWSASLGGYVADGNAFERLNAENSEKY